MFYNRGMKKPHPKQAIFPAICFSACLLIFVSQSVYGSSLDRNESSKINSAPSGRMTVISASFPHSIKTWEKEISLAANDTQLDPNLIAAVMLIESNGQAEVISSSGAVGLMQVMPNDGLAASFMCPNGPCFENRPSTSDLKNPDFNIFYGSELLASLIAQFGSVRAGLKAYGPMDQGYGYADLVLSTYNNIN